MDVRQIHFQEKVTEDENPNPEWLNGKIAGFDMEDSTKDAYLPLAPEHFAEMEKQNKTSEYRSYLWDSKKEMEVSHHDTLQTRHTLISERPTP